MEVQSSPKFLTEAEAATLLRSDRCTLWRWRHARRDPLPCCKLGSGPKAKLLYDTDAIAAWIARRRIEPNVLPRPRLSRTRRPRQRKATVQAEGVRA